MTSISNEEVRATIDAAIADVNKELRELNNYVSH